MDIGKVAVLTYVITLIGPLIVGATYTVWGLTIINEDIGSYVEVKTILLDNDTAITVRDNEVAVIEKTYGPPVLIVHDNETAYVNEGVLLPGKYVLRANNITSTVKIYILRDYDTIMNKYKEKDKVVERGLILSLIVLISSIIVTTYTHRKAGYNEATYILVVLALGIGSIATFAVVGIIVPRAFDIKPDISTLLQSIGEIRIPYE